MLCKIFKRFLFLVLKVLSLNFPMLLPILIGIKTFELINNFNYSKIGFLLISLLLSLDIEEELKEKELEEKLEEEKLEEESKEKFFKKERDYVLVQHFSVSAIFVGLLSFCYYIDFFSGLNSVIISFVPLFQVVAPSLKFFLALKIFHSLHNENLKKNLEIVDLRTKNLSLKIKNSELECENLELEIKNSELEIKNSDLESKIENLL